MPDEESTEKTIHRISDFFDAGWKILGAIGALVLFIVQIALGWYKIGDNATDISNLEKKMEVGFVNEAEKRTTRISATDAKFDKVDKKYDDLVKQVDELQKEIYYLKGVTETKK